MKPTIQFNEKSSGDPSDRRSRKGSALPKTDYGFQAAPVMHGGGRCFGAPCASFRSISQNYFTNEAPQSFASEAALFTVIVVTAAVPILNSVSELLHLVRSFGAL